MPQCSPRYGTAPGLVWRISETDINREAWRIMVKRALFEHIEITTKDWSVNALQLGIIKVSHPGSIVWDHRAGPLARGSYTSVLRDYDSTRNAKPLQLL